MNKKYFILFICSVIFITILSITIAILSNTNKNDIDDKLEQEIEYIESKLLGMLNCLNNISLSSSALIQEDVIDNKSNSTDKESENGGSVKESDEEEAQSQNSGQNSQNASKEDKQSAEYKIYNAVNSNILLQDNNIIDWEYLSNTVESLYSSWPTIMIDLNSTNINNQNILTFSNYLDELVISIQKQDKRQTLSNLAILYSHLPIYIEHLNNDAEKINISKTKMHIINSYVLLEDENWDKIEEEITAALNDFSQVMNSLNKNNGQQNINKTYIAINEIINCLKIRDKKLFYLKYVNLMENILKI